MNSDDPRQDQIADFLALQSTAIAELAESLRVLVKRAVPTAIERLRPGWRLIGYDVPLKGTRTTYFAWVLPEVGHVHVGWQTGTLMDDPEHMLRGAHLKLKKVRYLTFQPGDRVPTKVVLDFTRDAVRIAAMSPGERHVIASLREQPGGPR